MHSVLLSRYPFKQSENHLKNEVRKYTETGKNKNLPYSTLNDFLTADRSCATKYKKKTIIEVCNLHLYPFLAPFASIIRGTMIL